jgi:hypothetical protein
MLAVKKALENEMDITTKKFKIASGIPARGSFRLFTTV